MEQPQYDPLPDPIYPEPYSPAAAPAPVPVYDPATGQPKNNKTLIIIIVVVAVLLLCCCCVGGIMTLGPTISEIFDEIMYELSRTLPQLLAG